MRLQGSDFLVSLVHQFLNLGQLRKVSFGKRTVVSVLAYLGLKDSDLLLSGSSTNLAKDRGLGDCKRRLAENPTAELAANPASSGLGIGNAIRSRIGVQRGWS